VGYNAVTDNTSLLHSFIVLLPSKSAKFFENAKLQQFKVIQGHRYWCQSKAHMRLPISDASKPARRESMPKIALL